MQAETNSFGKSQLGRSSDIYAEILHNTLSKSKTLLGQSPPVEVQYSATTYSRTYSRPNDTKALIRSNITQDIRALNYPLDYRREKNLDSTERDLSASFTQNAQATISQVESENDKQARKEMVEHLRRTTTLEPRTTANLSAAKQTLGSDLNPATQYHELKHQDPPKLTKELIQFLSTRLNPPNCMIDLLDSLVSLLFGIYSRIEQHYFALGEKKYFLYKQYLSSASELQDTTSHLKLYLETQGLPERNVCKAEAALARYYESSKRPEANSYLTHLSPLVTFLKYHITYHRVLAVVSNLK
jgi:hypothetical protein